jgi:hypothetical protein
MTTIWIDPTELSGMASTLQASAATIDNATAGVRSTCACALPPAIADYVAEELSCIEGCGQQASAGFIADAIDILTRAAQVLLDQSLATAASSAFGPAATTTVGGTPVFGDWLSGMDTAIVGGTVVGGTPVFGDWLSGMGTAIVGGPASPPFDVVGPDGIGSPGYSIVGGPTTNSIASLPGPIFDIVSNSNANIIGTILAPNGLTYDNGSYVDGGGDRSNNLAGAYVDSSGRYDLP